MGRRGPLPDDAKATTGEPPEAPEHLDGEALLEWQRIVKELSPVAIARADRAALEIYVTAWAQMQDAARNIEATGTVIQLPNGYPGPSPYLKVYHAALRICTKLLNEFGGTPAGRARLPKLGDDEAEDLDI